MSNITDAMNTLLRTSALATHEEMLARCVNVDSHEINEDALADWHWSSGEEVLLGVLKVIARGRGRVYLDDLFKLDRQNQECVLLALRIRFGLLGSVSVEDGAL